MAFALATPQAQGQCPTDLLTGQNLVINGDFEQGYSNWTFTGGAGGYNIFTPPGWSNPGNIYVGTNPVTFNPGPPSFMNYGDHTSGSGNMLMVDGVCTAGIKLFQQAGIPIKPSTNYYFSVWISSLKDQPNFPGLLNFDINGTNVGALIQAPATGGSWIKYEIVWNSGATPPPTVTISIENSNTTGCASEVDFAIDDVSFIPGCAYGSPGPQPNLGPDQTICGKGGSILLNSNVPHNATTTVTWNDGTTGTGLGAPYTKTITAPGTYSVCVTDNGSCVKSDVIVISNNFSINLGPDLNLCNPATTTLDAQFTGTGVTYQWYKSYPTLAPTPNTAKTYFVTSPGTYRVDVTDPVCGVRSDVIVITSSAPTPVDAYYCNAGETPTLSVTGAGTFNWYNTPTKGTGTLLASNTSSYTIPAPGLTPTATYTYYVEDATITSGVVGQTTEFTTGSQNNYIYNLNQRYTQFTVSQDFNLNSVQIPIRISNPNGTINNTMAIRLEVCDASGNQLSPRLFSISNNVVIPYNANTFALYTFSFTGFSIPASLGPNLTMKLFITDGGGSTRLTNYEDWRFEIGERQGITTSPYPYNSTVPGVVSITGYRENGNPAPNKYALYNWNIGATTPCARTPVRAIYNCPTPVDWLSFDAIKQNGAVLLTWATTKESNNSHFDVMRSIDGTTWTKVGSVQGNGNSSSIHYYSYIDNQSIALTAYYKIVQVDYNGDSYSTNIKSKSGDHWSIIAYPNPFDNSTNLVVSGSNEDAFTYTVHAVTGQLVWKGTGTSNTEISLGDGLASGVYVVAVQLADDVKTIKITKK
jgi:hypothetical protein